MPSLKCMLPVACSAQLLCVVCCVVLQEYVNLNNSDSYLMAAGAQALVSSKAGRAAKVRDPARLLQSAGLHVPARACEAQRMHPWAKVALLLLSHHQQEGPYLPNLRQTVASVVQ